MGVSANHNGGQSAMTDSPLPTGPITDDEIMWLRRRRRDEERAAWVMRLLKRWFWYVSASIAALYGAYEVLAKHFTIR